MSEQGRINQYICQQCGKPTTTINEVDGTTSFMLRCRQPGCDGMAESQFYRVPQDAIPTHGWYKPDAAELAKANDEVREHVANGGLMIRELTDYRGKVGRPNRLASTPRRSSLLAAVLASTWIAPTAMPSIRPRRTRYISGTPRVASNTNVGRNDPCPCGSGKKFKKCCLWRSRIDAK